MNSSISEGNLVLHPNKPDWGPGKVVRIEGLLAHIVFRDTSDADAKKIRMDAITLVIAPSQRDPILDNLPPLTERDGTLSLPSRRVTMTEARDQFHGLYPLGFNDLAYLGTKRSGERTYKVLAHEQFVSVLGDGQFERLLMENWQELVSRILKIVGSVNLLSPRFEAGPLRDALKVEAPAREFLDALGGVLRAPTMSEQEWTPYFESVANLPAERGRVATWPVATILPFLAQPERQMFLKPEIVEKTANAIGFNLNYRSQPNWLTYAKLLELSQVVRDQIGDLRPRDMIDVQSFMWVAFHVDR